MIKRVVSQPLTKRFSAKEIEELRETFESLDKDGSGSLNVDEIERYLAQVDLDPQNARLIVRVFDEDRDGAVSFDEFVKYLQAMNSIQDDSLLMFRLLFESLDTNRTGGLDAKEIVEFMSLFGDALTEEEAQKFVESVDMNHDGRIEFNELMQVLGLK